MPGWPRCLTPFRMMALAGVLPGLAALVMLWSFRPDGVVLQWHFTKDRPFVEESSVEMQYHTKVDGLGLGANASDTVTLQFQWTPKVQDETRNWIIDRRLQRVIFRLGSLEDQLLYDSANAATGQNPYADGYKEWIGTKSTLTVGPLTSGGIIELPRTGTLSVAAEEARNVQQNLAEFVLLWTPPGPVHPGDTWEAERELPMGWMGIFQVRCRFTYLGPDEKLDRIAMEMDLVHQPPKATMAKQAICFKAGRLHAEPGAGGTASFDRNRGRLAHAEIAYRLKGKITLQVAGSNDAELDVDTPTRVTINIRDLPPATK